MLYEGDFTLIVTRQGANAAHQTAAVEKPLGLPCLMIKQAIVI